LGIALHHHQHPHLVFNFPSFPFWNCEAYAERRSLCRVPSDWALPCTTTNILIWYSISPHSLSDGEAYAERRSLCRVPSDWALPCTTTNILIWYSISPHSLSGTAKPMQNGEAYAVFNLIAHCAAPSANIHTLLKVKRVDSF
jgi:hypothetical protein